MVKEVLRKFSGPFPLSLLPLYPPQETKNLM